MQVHHRRSRSSRGFTLIEVLLVLAIIGVIMAIAVPALMGRRRQANIEATRIQISAVENALDMYANDHDGIYPNSGDGLMVLIANPGNSPQWRGPYLKNTQQLPMDAWQQPLSYAFPGTRIGTADRPDIWSNGPDRTPNTPDDIGNWSPMR
jgi:general secretion pathway protein G